MTAATNELTHKDVCHFEPLSRLNNDDGNELLQSAMTIQLSPDTQVFGPDDKSNRVFFLIDGALELTTAQGKRLSLSPTDKSAHTGIASSGKVYQEARALTYCDLLVFDADMLDMFMSWTSPGHKMRYNDEYSDNRVVIDQLLQSKGLLRFSETQIKNLLTRMREITVNAGDTVVRQDDLDDYYYLIKSGRCEVSRSPGEKSNPIKLAELNKGETFGEEALLANQPRNATVTMLETGSLMQLSKTDFSNFLADPLLNTLSWDETRELMRSDAIVIDVRLPEEHQAENIPGSINIPLSMLRLRVGQLSPQQKYILYCNDGGRSAVAAFLLSQQGLNAYLLDGGLGVGNTPHVVLKPTDAIAQTNTAKAPSNDPLFIDSNAPIETHEREPTRWSWGQKLIVTIAISALLSTAALYYSQDLQQKAVQLITPDHIAIGGYKIHLHQDSGNRKLRT